MKTTEHLLRRGDILTIESGEDWIAKATSWLTNSNVGCYAIVIDETHLMMANSDNSAILIQNFAVKDSGGRTAYQLRMDAEADIDEFMAAAEHYRMHMHYAFPFSAVLACLSLYRPGPATERYRRAVEALMLFALEELDTLIAQSADPEKIFIPFVQYSCSACGYDLNIPEGAWERYADLQCEKKDTILPITEISPNLSRVAENKALPKVTEQNLEKLAKELYEAATEKVPADNGASVSVIYVELLLDKIEKIHHKFGVTMPIDALFITPADLINNAMRLKYIARLTLCLEASGGLS